jgi:hypothetical protein
MEETVERIPTTVAVEKARPSPDSEELLSPVTRIVLLEVYWND